MEHVNPAHLQPRHDHERTDLRVRIVLIFTGALVLVALFIHLFIGWLFNFLDRVHREETGPPISILSPPRELPPAPRLQVQPQVDLQQLRVDEDARLNDYGWSDRQHGLVRIPIDRAMDIVAQRGLPVTKPGAKPATRPFQKPTPKGGDQSNVTGGQNVPAPR